METSSQLRSMRDQPWLRVEAEINAGSASKA